MIWRHSMEDTFTWPLFLKLNRSINSCVLLKTPCRDVLSFEMCEWASGRKPPAEKQVLFWKTERYKENLFQMFLPLSTNSQKRILVDSSYFCLEILVSRYCTICSDESILETIYSFWVHVLWIKSVIPVQSFDSWNILF